MFYDYRLLRRKGRYGVIWLAATYPNMLTRKEYMTVNVSSFCEDILHHFLWKDFLSEKRVPFSMYLTSQLTFGLIMVNKKLADILLADLQSFHKRVRSVRIAQKLIDLPRPKRNQRKKVTIDEPEYDRCSFVSGATSLARFGMNSNAPAAEQPILQGSSSLHIADSKDITIEEIPMEVLQAASTLEAEFFREEEVCPSDGSDILNVPEDPEFFLDTGCTSHTSELPQEANDHAEMPPTIPPETDDFQNEINELQEQFASLKITDIEEPDQPPVNHEDVPLLPKELTPELPQPVVSDTMDLQPIISVERQRKKQRKRKVRPLIIDKKTSISGEEMTKQIFTANETLTMKHILLIKRKRTTAELLSAPGTRILSSVLQTKLWVKPGSVTESASTFIVPDVIEDVRVQLTSTETASGDQGISAVSRISLGASEKSTLSGLTSGMPSAVFDEHILLSIEEEVEDHVAIGSPITGFVEALPTPADIAISTDSSEFLWYQNPLFTTAIALKEILRSGVKPITFRKLQLRTKKNAATVFIELLKLHKMQLVTLVQLESFGEIEIRLDEQLETLIFKDSGIEEE